MSSLCPSVPRVIRCRGSGRLVLTRFRVLPCLRDVTPDEKGAYRSVIREMERPEDGEQVGRRELLANIRRLTIAVLDSLEEGSRDKTLDQGEKRLLSSTGARLLRLWRTTLNDGEINQTAGRANESAVGSEESTGRVS